MEQTSPSDFLRIYFQRFTEKICFEITHLFYYIKNSLPLYNHSPNVHFLNDFQSKFEHTLLRLDPAFAIHSLHMILYEKIHLFGF